MTFDSAPSAAGLDDDGPTVINYEASPTCSRFHLDDSLVRGLRGPIGSGKSVACCLEIMLRATQQEPSPIDGVRYSRWAIIRNTYPELQTTTIKTWLEWFEDITTMRYGAPITGLVEFDDVHLELVFLALDRPKDVKKLLSLEITGAWLNEARELHKATVDGALSRCGRYPSLRHGGATWRGVIMDTNPPDDSHWWYKFAEEDTPAGWKFFAQPPALIGRVVERNGIKETVYGPNPKAENVKHHKFGYDYWLAQVGGKSTEWVKVYLLGQYGTVLDGRPVFPEYRDEFHCSPTELKPIPNLPLRLGWDWGRTPAVIIGQLTARGQLRVIDEVVVNADGDGMGIRTFVRTVVKPYLATHYPGYTIALSYGDPSGVAKDGSDHSSFDIVGQEGIPTVPAPSNDPVDRQDAVVRHLNGSLDGEPMFLLSPRCHYIRRGFQGGYRYATLQVSAGDGVERVKPHPEKNRYSHPHDALQHLCQTSTAGNTVRATAKAKPVTAPTPAAWT